MLIGQIATTIALNFAILPSGTRCPKHSAANLFYGHCVRHSASLRFDQSHVKSFQSVQKSSGSHFPCCSARNGIHFRFLDVSCIFETFESYSEIICLDIFTGKLTGKSTEPVSKKRRKLKKNIRAPSMRDSLPLKSPQSKFLSFNLFFSLLIIGNWWMSSLNCCSARNANQFTVSVNIEPEQKIFFNLTYEELLSRRKGIYEHVKQNF